MTASTSVAHYRGFSEQEPRLLNAFTQAPLSLFKFWIDGTLVSVVEGGEASGFEASKALAKHYKDAFRESPELVSCIDRAYSGAPVNTTLELGGRPWDARFFPTHDSTRGVMGVVAILTDASDRLTAFRVLRTLDILASVSRCLARSDDEASFIHQICTQIEQTRSAAFIGLVDRRDKTKAIQVLTGEGRARDFFLTQNLVWDAVSKAGQSIASESIRTGRPQIANHLLGSKECEVWYDAARRFGWTAAMALPLLSDAASVGVLVLFGTDSFESQEIPMWEHVATEIIESIVVLRERARQKQIAAERGEAEDNYRRLVETAFDIIIEHQDLKVVDINAAGVKHAGASGRDVLIGAPLVSLIAAQDRQRVLETLLRTQEEGSVDVAKPVEFKLLGLNGTVTDVEGVTVPIKHAGTSAQLSVLRDISQRKNQEKALFNAKASLDYAQRVANMGSVDLDVVSGKAAWSANAFHILGFEDQRPTDEGFFDVLNAAIGDEQEKLRVLLEHIRIKGAPADAEIRVGKGASHKTIHIHGIPIYEERGAANRIFFVLQDLSELRMIERGLKKTTDRLRKAQEIGHLGDFEIDIANQKMWLSQAASELLELRDADTEMSLDAFYKGFSASDHAIILSNISPVLSGNQDTFSADAMLAHRERWVSIEGSRTISDGELKIIGNVQDITDRKKVELNIKQSEARLKRAQQVARVWEFWWDIEKDCITWSETLSTILGVEPPMQTLTFDQLMVTLREQDRQAFKLAAHNTIHHGVPGEVEYLQSLYNGSKVRVVSRWEASRRNALGEVVGIAGITQDVTSLREAQERVAYKERFHFPTGLPNTQIALDRLAYLLSVENASGGFGIVGLKLLGYKKARGLLPEEQVYGAIKEAATTTRKAFSDIDLVARMERGQFVVLVRNVTLSSLQEIATRIASIWTEQFSRLEAGIIVRGVTTSVKCPEESTDLDGIVKLVLHRLSDLTT
jgi:PAS domain S-box-containing protein